MARFSIILGAYLMPIMMSVYIGLIVTCGILLIYLSLYGKKAALKAKKTVKASY